MPQRELRPKNGSKVNDCIFRLPKKEIRKPFLSGCSDHEVDGRRRSCVEHRLQPFHSDLRFLFILQPDKYSLPRVTNVAQLRSSKWIRAHLRFIQLACLNCCRQFSCCTCYLFPEISLLQKISSISTIAFHYRHHTHRKLSQPI